MPTTPRHQRCAGSLLPVPHGESTCMKRIPSAAVTILGWALPSPIVIPGDSELTGESTTNNGSQPSMEDSAELNRLATEYARQVEKAELAAKVAEGNTDFDESLLHELQRSTNELRDLRSTVDQERRQSQREISLLKSQVARLAQSEVNRVERISKLEGDRQKLQDRLAIAEWKTASLRNRRWWRLGQALGFAKNNPAKVSTWISGLGDAMRTTEVLPRPEPRQLARSTPKRSEPVGSKSNTQPGQPTVVVGAPPRPKLDDVRVAAVLDTMSEQSFGPECRLITFTPQTWRDTLEREVPHVLLVESAWRGNSGSWEYKVGTYAYPESVGLPHLTALVDWCKKRSIPTVFWNKEDPVHFEKFIEAAGLFDVVLTTDSDSIERYRQRLGSEPTLESLQFAAQPKIHNPAGTLRGRDPRPVFAGTFYRNRHSDRRVQLEMLLDAALPHGLIIYDRMDGVVNDDFGFPERFQASVRGGVPYESMIEIYKQHMAFLNTNSVVDSPTMFSRRVFELLACGTPVVSTPSVGMEDAFAGIVETVRTDEEAGEAIGSLLESGSDRTRRVRNGINNVAAQHLYEHRLRKILRLAAVDIDEDAGRVNLIGRSGQERLTESSALNPIDLPGNEGVATELKAVARQDPESWWAIVDGSHQIPEVEKMSSISKLVRADIYGLGRSEDEEHTFGPEVMDGPLLLSPQVAAQGRWDTVDGRLQLSSQGISTYRPILGEN